MQAQAKHNHQVIFGRKEADCARCDELKAGAPVRAGWFKPRPAYLSHQRDIYCFCPATGLTVQRCDTCHKPPYTD